MNKYVFITGSGRCGSTLIRSLLDGHSELQVYPIEASSFLEAYLEDSGYALEVPLKGPVPGTSPLQLDSKTRLMSRKALKQRIKDKRLETIRPNDVLDAAFELVFGCDSTYRVLDVTSPNIAGYLQAIPGSLAIHILRHPFDTLNSFFRERYHDPNSFGGAHPARWTMGLGFAAIFQSFSQAHLHLDHPSVAIHKLEDLQTQPATTISEVFRFLGLDAEEINLRLTSMGEPTGNNSTFKASDKVFKQPTDWSCLTRNDQYHLASTPYVRHWYDIAAPAYSRNKFHLFLLRMMGLFGRRRVLPTNIAHLTTRLFPALPGFYLQDILAKQRHQARVDSLREEPGDT